MPIDTWDEIRIAYQVARLGTVSGAADVLGVHHATVIRHIDALEARLGVRLFQRHARGYSATDAGRDLLQVAGATAEQFEQLEGRLHGHSASVSGELTVTSISILSDILTPVLAKFRAEHPELRIRFLTDTRLFRLEYGEAHVAVRVGKPSEDPDNVVQKLSVRKTTLYGTRDYVERHGLLGPDQSTKGHIFVGSSDATSRAPFLVWLNRNTTPDQIVYRTSSIEIGFDAVLAGVAAGFLPCWTARHNKDLVALTPPRDEWDTPIWLVTHVDLHRTAKVQSFTAALKAAAVDWND